MTQPLRPGPKKTSLMKISPSLRALEKVLNSEGPVRATAEVIPEVILEENESPDTSTVVVEAPTITKNILKENGPSEIVTESPDSGHSSTTNESEKTVTVTTELPHKLSELDPDNKSKKKSSDTYFSAPPNLVHKATVGPDGSTSHDVALPPKAKRPLLEKKLTNNSKLSNLDVELHPEKPVTNSMLLDTAFVPKPVYRPVKSMLGSSSPVLTATKPKEQPISVSRDMHSGSTSILSSKSSSVFGTPKTSSRLPENTPHKSPNLNGVVRGTNAQEVSQLTKSSQVTPANHKRFSFRGLFKLKSRNHLLARVKEEEPPSKPRKILAKSPLTPNFLDLVEKSPKEPKELRGLFRRRKSQSTMDFISEETPKTMSKSATDGAISLRSKPLPLVQKEQDPGISKSISRNLPNLPEPQLSAISYPNTPQLSEQLAFVSTPATGVLSAESNTIREVDDSDYLVKLPEMNSNSRSQAWEPQTPNIDDNEEYADDLTTDDITVGLHDLSLIKDTNDLFGSPFIVPLPYEDSQGVSFDKISIGVSSETDRNQDLESGRVSIPIKEQLVGEALFPKSLSPHEVESIISLERSVSMRSLRSNGKRSSFLNYDGTDENVLLGNEVGKVGGMRRSGSILKNSLSSKSLRAEVLNLIDAALEEDKTVDTFNTNIATERSPTGPIIIDSVKEKPISESSSLENFSELIEFSDFIDFDNLDFNTDQDMLGSDLNDHDYNKAQRLPQISDYSREVSNIDTSDRFVENGATNCEGNQRVEENQDEEERDDDEQDRYEEAEYEEETDDEDAEHTQNAEDHKESNFRDSSDYHKEQEIIVVNSSTDRDFSQLPELIESSYQDSQAQDDTSQSFELGYGLAVTEKGEQISPNLGARPFSMSFRGFNGSLGKSKVIAKHDLHQLLQYCNDSSNESSSVVGQGFGFSDDEISDDERELTDDYLQTYNLSADESSGSARVGKNRQKVPTTSTERRQQHLKNVLQLQPPLQTLPFHHDRIPSISDQSAMSSPGLLTSFMGRLRKTPPSQTERPTVRFSSRIILYDTYHPEEYDRHPDVATCNQLTPLLAQQIKVELSQIKAEMTIHPLSRHNTHFF